MIQGVREVFEIVDLDHDTAKDAEKGDDEGEKGKEMAKGMGKMVLIGRGLDQDLFERSLRWWVFEGGEAGGGGS